MTHPYFRRASRPRILAHRGLVITDGASMPVLENTIAAVSAAQAIGAEYVEVDCRRTSDGEIVVIHDASLQRTLGDPRLVRDITSAELSDLLADRGGLLSLRTALEAFPTTRFNIDVKEPAIADALGREIAPHADRVLVTSFHERSRLVALESARREGGAPATSAGRNLLLRILLALRTGRGAQARNLLRTLDAIQIPVSSGPVRVLSPALIRAAHDVECEVHVWTINDPDEMTRLLDAGVDGIVTDRADLALARLR